MLKIIAGKYKGRSLPLLRSGKYRPSRGMLREAIFSILQNYNMDFESLRALDLFAGTGSLGFEAASRWGCHVTFADKDPKHLNAIKSFATILKIPKEKADFVLLDALDLPALTAASGFDLLFIDPPYFKNLAASALESLISQRWLAPGALLVIELAKKEDLKLPAQIRLVQSKIYNNNKLLIALYKG